MLTSLSDVLGIERAMPLVLFALYLLTSVQLCSYAGWRQSGAPNPFLPRRIKLAVARFERHMRMELRASC